MKKLWLIIGCIVVISAFAAGYATMQQTARKEKETLAADVPFVTAIRDRELNGAIGYEWIDANSEEIEIGHFDAVLLTKHDGENLYLGLEIATGERFDSLELYAAFDTNRNGDFFDQGDDILIITLEKGDFVKSEDIDYFYPETYQFALDRDFGGTNNAIGVVSVDTILLEDNVVYTAEFKKSLTGDAGMDMELRPGDEVDMVIGVIGKASPAVEQVSETIRMWLKTPKGFVDKQIGKVRYLEQKVKKDKSRLVIQIPTKTTKPIYIDPSEFDQGKFNKDKNKKGYNAKGSYDKRGKMDDLAWYRDVNGDGIKDLVIDLDGNGTIDLVQIKRKGELKEYSAGLNKDEINVSTGIGGASIDAPKGSVPAGATVTITDKSGKSRTVTANDDGSINFTGLGDLNIASFDEGTIVLRGSTITITFR